MLTLTWGGWVLSSNINVSHFHLNLKSLTFYTKNVLSIGVVVYGGDVTLHGNSTVQIKDGGTTTLSAPLANYERGYKVVGERALRVFGVTAKEGMTTYRVLFTHTAI